MTYRVTLGSSVYKSSKWMQLFLENVVQQTIFDQCKLHLIDANSPDNEYEIIKPFLKEYSNIYYERLDYDPGATAVQNMTIKASQSEYHTIANTDDKMFPTCLEEHIKIMDEDPEIDLVYCQNATTFDYETSFDSLNQILLFPTAEFSIENMLTFNLPHNHPVWRRSMHDDCGYFEEERWPVNADYEFWLRCVYRGKNFKLLNKILGVYFRNPEGASTKEEDMERNVRHSNEIRQMYIDLFKERGLNA
jgi:hypothetical protein